MEVRLYYDKDRRGIEIQLAGNHSLILSFDAAKKLADDILAILSKNPLIPESENQSSATLIDKLDDSKPLLQLPIIRILGVYKITPTRSSIVRAIHFHGYKFLLDEEGNLNDDINWDEFDNLTLIELQIMGMFSLDHINHITQNEQAPYMEFFLDESGQKLIPEQEIHKTINPRVCFFLHSTDPTKPIRFGDENLELPAISHLPERLYPFTHYIPVD